MKKGLVLFLKALTLPQVLLPFLFVLFCLAIPQLGDLNNFILLGTGRWSYDLLSTNSLLNGVVYSIGFMLFINKLKGKKFWKLMVLAQFINTLGLALSGIVIFAQYFSIPFMFIAFFFINIIQNLGQDMLLIPLVGRISKYLPDGFESTGITVVISFVNLSGITNNLMSAYEIQTFDCLRGYYHRTTEPLQWNVGLNVVLMALCPLFLAWG